VVASNRVPRVGDLVILRLDIDESFQDNHGLGIVTEISPLHPRGVVRWYCVKWLKSEELMRFHAGDLRIVTEVGDASA